MSQTARIIIVGGGIAGLATAIALRKIGEAPLVLEQAPELREIGAGLLLGPNGCTILDRLGVLEALRDSSRSVEVPNWEVLDSRGRILSRMRLPLPGEISLSTRRSDLQRALLAELPPESIQTGRTVQRVTMEPDGVHLELATGGHVQAERLIAADGGASAVREALWPGRRPVYRGYVGWRALVEFCPPGWEHGRVTESWGRGRRFGIAPVGAGRTYWYASANVPASSLPMTPSLSSLRRDFSDWHSPVPELLEATPDDALLLHPISDQAPLQPPYLGDRAVMIGDAAHLLTPNLGQGASLALEDAWELAATWHHPDGFDAFARRRRERIHRLWHASRRLGGVIQWELPLLCAARDFAVKTFPDVVAASFLRRLLRHEPGDLAGA